MSRVIKFRAWHHGAGDPRVTPFMRSSEPFNVLFWQNVETDDLGVEVMQFTGLTDKNGVDIYEGDICHIEGFGNGAVEVCSFSGVEFHHVNGHSISALDCASEEDEFEVIGNVHQNPELLK